MVTIVSPEVSDDDVKGTTNKVHNLITSKGGLVTRVQRWGKRKLAYPIKHHVEGHYILTCFDMDPQLTSELDADLKVSEEVIKHLMVRAAAPPPELQDSAEESSAAKVEDGKAAAETPVTEAATQTEETTEPITAETDVQTEDAVEPTIAETKTEAKDATGPEPAGDEVQTEEPVEPATVEGSAEESDETSTNTEQGGEEEKGVS